MAIILKQAPLPLQFSRNAIELKFECPDKFTTKGKYSRISMRYTAYPTTAGATLKLEYTKDGETHERTFTFVAAPDADEYEILLYPGSNPLAWVQNHLLPGLLSDPDIALDFQIGISSTDPHIAIDLIARYYDNTDPSFTATNSTITQNVVVGGAIPVSQPFYRLSAWLYVGRNSESMLNFDPTTEIELDADRNGEVKLDLQDYADALIDAVETPTPITGSPVLCTAINRPAYILYGQKYGDLQNPTRKRNYRTDIFRIQKGGLERRLWAAVKNNIQQHFETDFLTLNMERRHATQQLDWLTWLCPMGTVTDVTLFMQSFSATQSGVINQLWSIDTALPGRAYQFRVDNLAAIVPTGHTYYHIWLIYNLNNNLITTKKLIIHLDNNYLDRVFQFENSFGAIESMCFAGESIINASANRNAYEKDFPFSGTPQDTTLHTYGRSITKTITCSTGALTATQALAVADFLASNHHWLIQDNKRIPVRINNQQAAIDALNHEANYARGITFTAEINKEKSLSQKIN